MAWPKIKNIIILILLGTNLCLLAFAVSRGIGDRQQQEQARANAISFLQEQGIEMDEELVPKTMELQPQIVRRDAEQECVLAAALLDGEVSVEARGAEVYRYYNQNGSVQFHSNGEFSARFSGDGIPVGEMELEEHGRQLLERLEFRGELLRMEQEGENYALTYREFWKEMPLLNCQATLRYEKGNLVGITAGRRLAGEPEVDNSAQQITVATALMKFYTGMKAPGDVYTQITGITPGYVVSSTLSETMPLVPVWHISTDVGTFQLDITTGTPSRISGS